MKKQTKPKASKSPKAAADISLDLVTAMTKLVERLEILERKTDQVLGRLGSLPSQLTQAAQNFQRPEPPRHVPPSQHPQGNPQQSHGPRERIMYKAVCADCCKTCEVPFKPTAERPVYCKECFTIRKAGHTPKDLTANVVVPHHLKEIKAAPAAGNKAPAVPQGKASKPAAKSGKKPGKKKKK